MAEVDDEEVPIGQRRRDQSFISRETREQPDRPSLSPRTFPDPSRVDENHINIGPGVLAGTKDGDLVPSSFKNITQIYSENISRRKTVAVHLPFAVQFMGPDPNDAEQHQKVKSDLQFFVDVMDYQRGSGFPDLNTQQASQWIDHMEKKLQPKIMASREQAKVDVLEANSDQVEQLQQELMQFDEEQLDQMNQAGTMTSAGSGFGASRVSQRQNRMYSQYQEALQSDEFTKEQAATAVATQRVLRDHAEDLKPENQFRDTIKEYKEFFGAGQDAPTGPGDIMWSNVKSGLELLGVNLDDDTVLESDEVQEISQRMIELNEDFENVMEQDFASQMLPGVEGPEKEELNDIMQKNMKLYAGLQVLDSRIQGEQVENTLKEIGGFLAMGAAAEATMGASLALATRAGVASRGTWGLGTAISGLVRGASFEAGAWFGPGTMDEIVSNFTDRDVQWLERMNTAKNGFLIDVAFWGMFAGAVKGPQALNTVRKNLFLNHGEEIIRRQADADSWPKQQMWDTMARFMKTTHRNEDVEQLNRLMNQYKIAQGEEQTRIGDDIMDLIADSSQIDESLVTPDNLKSAWDDLLLRDDVVDNLDFARGEADGLLQKMTLDKFGKSNLEDLTVPERAQLRHMIEFADNQDYARKMAEDYVREDRLADEIVEAMDDTQRHLERADLFDIPEEELGRFQKITDIENAPSFIKEMNDIIAGRSDTLGEGAIRQLGPWWQINANIQQKTGVPAFHYAMRMMDARRESIRLAKRGSDNLPGSIKIKQKFDEWGLTDEQNDRVFRFLFDMEQGRVQDKVGLAADAGISELPTQAFRNYNMTREEIQASRWIRTFFEDAKQVIPTDNFVSNYLTRDFEGQSMDRIWQSMMKEARDKNLRSPNALDRVPGSDEFADQNFDRLHKDLERILHNYVYYARRDQVFRPEFQKYKQIVLGADKNLQMHEIGRGTDLTEGVGRYPVSEHDVGYIRSFLDEVAGYTSNVRQTNDKIVQQMLSDMKSMDPEAAAKASAFMKQNDLTRSSSIWYWNLMGYSGTTAIKNRTQESLNIGMYGIGNWLKGKRLQMSWSPGNKENLERIVEELNVRDQFMQFAKGMTESQSLEFGESTIKRMARNIGDPLVGFSASDRGNVASSVSTASVAFDDSISMLNRTSRGRISQDSWRAFQSETGIQALPQAIKDEVRRRIDEGNVQMFRDPETGNAIGIREAVQSGNWELNKDSAQWAAVKAQTHMTQFDYGRATHGMAFLKSGRGRFSREALENLLVFATWRINYANYLSNLAKNPAQNADKFAHTLIAQKQAGHLATQVFDRDISDFQKAGPFQGNLLPSPVVDGGKALSNILFGISTGPHASKVEEKQNIPYRYTSEGMARQGIRSFLRLMVGPSTLAGRGAATAGVAELMIDKMTYGTMDKTDMFQMLETMTNMDVRNIGIDDKQKLSEAEDKIFDAMNEGANWLVGVNQGDDEDVDGALGGPESLGTGGLGNTGSLGQEGL